MSPIMVTLTTDVLMATCQVFDAGNIFTFEQRRSNADHQGEVTSTQIANEIEADEEELVGTWLLYPEQHGNTDVQYLTPDQLKTTDDHDIIE